MSCNRAGKSHVRSLSLSLFILLIFSMTFSNPASAQGSDALTYQLPPKAILDLVDAPQTPYVSIDPTSRWMLLQDHPNLISIEELAQPELRLAGSRINPSNHSSSRGVYVTGLKLLEIRTGQEFEITGILPNAKIRNIGWSPDGSRIAFLNSKENGQDLWVVDVSKKSAKILIRDKMTSVYGSAFTWLPDNKTLICKLFEQAPGSLPAESAVPAGPVIQETSGRKSPAPTYQDLLKSPYDEVLFDYYFQSQVCKVSIDGKQTRIGKEGIHRSVEPSPDGKYLLVQTVHRPYSYLVPSYRFPVRVEIWDLNGNVIKQIADLSLAEEIPNVSDAVSKGPRSFEWRSDASATLCWAEAQDGGDPRTKAEARDHVYILPAPFTDNPVLLTSLTLRYSTILWGNANLALVYERWHRDRRVRVWEIDPSSGADEKTVLFDYSSEDRYKDPGSPVQKNLPNGQSVLLLGGQGSTLYLIGDGASPEGDRPFLDAYDLTSKETKRLWRSEAPFYEEPIALLDSAEPAMITRRESVTEPPNYFIRDLEDTKLSQITHFPHPTPQLKDVQKELIRYERSDGVPMTATLYLPQGYKKEDGPLPLLMWAYPTEFKSADAAGQVTDSPCRFVRISPSSALLWLAHGYAILDDPTMPIIGEGDAEPNDTYVEQLVASAQAAADEVVRRGIADRNRLAVGGHSYGAFMTANLLAHSDIFAAGIARSGAYNRTLTPFGFQAEDRTFWEAPEVYMKMSPFAYADKINEPILLIHGMADNNTGTFPIQSERFYNALKGHGGTARLVMLPLESHGYRSRESILHMLWEMTNWLDKYVKRANE